MAEKKIKKWIEWLENDLGFQVVNDPKDVPLLFYSSMSFWSGSDYRIQILFFEKNLFKVALYVDEDVKPDEDLLKNLPKKIPIIKCVDGHETGEHKEYDWKEAYNLLTEYKIFLDSLIPDFPGDTSKE